jgi:hypothetical protein
MSIHSVYRLGVWLPLAIPAAAAVLVHAADHADHADLKTKPRTERTATKGWVWAA